MLPYEKFAMAMTGSVLDQCKMGLFDNMQSDSVQGSRFETFAEMMHRQNHSLLGYSADVSASIKSDCTSLRTSRLSVASTFETAPIACSSLLSRASLDSQFAVNTEEFAVPKHPVRSRNLRNTEVESKDSEGHSSTLASGPNGEPPSGTQNAAGAVAQDSSVNNHEAHATELTNVKIVRKRGRKPKVLESIKENDSGTTTPPKRGRPRRPATVLSDTPNKGKSSAGGKEIKPNQTSDVGESIEASTSNTGNSSNPSDSKSSQDYLQEVEEALKDLRNRSYEIGTYHT